jgi:TetR/AcrR family transcriptional repressor of lmrAB and yxaGH operons
MARTIAERHDVIPALAEVFRQYGYEGASLSRMTQGTGLGKGSLYHFFPGGKQEMAAAVLEEVDKWFQEHVYTPLRQDGERGIAHMFAEVQRYFLSGRKVCLLGLFALGNERDIFVERVSSYFRDWVDALATALGHGETTPKQARDLAEQVVGGIQGALVLARAWDDTEAFSRQLKSLEERVRARAAIPASG